MPTYRDHAIVLKTAVVRDADRRYFFYTRGHGKVAVLAKGSRRSKSKMSPHLGGFGLVDVMIAKGKRIDRLAGASLERSYGRILDDLGTAAAAQGFLLVIDALTKQELPEERIFELAAACLETLDSGARGNAGAIFHAAVLQLLGILGLAPELEHCVRCRNPLPQASASLSIARGGFECGRCRAPESVTVTADAVKVLRFLVRQPLPTAARLRFTPGIHREILMLTDLFLAAHLDRRLPALGYVREWTRL
ncbi:DNA repair protein RecO [Candidatus Uhrbacteria bacterium]|nr:DNA repair protein RecO [Candidatus Uhrbacteria bacterium]